ncbi:MAG: hypothetical protein ACERKD_10085 [Prolixibacteraceae bacterium]
MKTTKQLGIWMDHSIAHITELKNEETLITTVVAQVEEEEKIPNPLDESRIQNKAQNQLSDYFNRLIEVIKTYDYVLLFGPTNAKTELFNLLKADRHFENINIEVRSTDRMTQNQQLVYLKDYFIRL